MDIQTIEPVLIDYVLGGATPEVAALVDAFQEKDAEAQACIERWSKLAGLARQAMENDQTRPLPAFPQRQMHVARQGAQRRRAMLWAASLAASLLVGYAIGNFGRGRQMAPEVAMTRSRPSPVEAANRPSSNASDFWSVARMRDVAQRIAQRPAPAPQGALENRRVGFSRYGG
jgi:hypothetical protein